MRRPGLVLCLAAILFVPQLRGEEVLDNNEVVRMIRAGLSPEIVEMKVKSTPGHFDVTTDGLIALKAAGVPDVVMAAMLKKESAPAASAPSPAKAQAVQPAPAQPAPAQPAATTAPATVETRQQTVPVVIAIADTKPACAKLAYEVAGEKAKRKTADICVEDDALSVDGMRIPFTSVVAHCRERSIGFPYTSDPDEWRFGDAAKTYRVFGSEKELSPIISAMSTRASSVPAGNCSSREMQKKLPLR